MKYSQKKGHRIKRCMKIKSLGNYKRSFDIRVLNNDTNLWYNEDTNNWEVFGSSGTYNISSSTYGVLNTYTLKAVLRNIKRWSVPKGTKFICSLPYIGHEVIITKK